MDWFANLTILWMDLMLTFDIPININVNANSEEEAEDIVAKLLAPEMSKPALQRSVNNWDFIEFVEGDEPDREFFMES